MAAAILLLGLALCAAWVPGQAGAGQAAGDGSSLYAANLSAVDIQGNVVHTGELAGKVTIVVNVACHCGYTDSNYKGLQRVYERYHEYGLEVLAFPCNQFGQQEAGSHEEIREFVTQRYSDQLRLMGKVEVNGAGQHPIFAWLKAHAPAAPGQQQGADVRWNFEKWLVNKQGQAIKRYSSDLVYHNIETDVYNALVDTPAGSGSEEQPQEETEGEL